MRFLPLVKGQYSYVWRSVNIRCWWIWVEIYAVDSEDVVLGRWVLTEEKWVVARHLIAVVQ